MQAHRGWPEGRIRAVSFGGPGETTESGRCSLSLVVTAVHSPSSWCRDRRESERAHGRGAFNEDRGRAGRKPVYFRFRSGGGEGWTGAIYRLPLIEYGESNDEIGGSCLLGKSWLVAGSPAVVTNRGQAVHCERSTDFRHVGAYVLRYTFTSRQFRRIIEPRRRAYVRRACVYTCVR